MKEISGGKKKIKEWNRIWVYMVDIAAKGKDRASMVKMKDERERGGFRSTNW